MPCNSYGYSDPPKKVKKAEPESLFDFESAFCRVVNALWRADSKNNLFDDKEIERHIRKHNEKDLGRIKIHLGKYLRDDLTVKEAKRLETFLSKENAKDILKTLQEDMNSTNIGKPLESILGFDPDLI